MYNIISQFLKLPVCIISKSLIYYSFCSYDIIISIPAIFTTSVLLTRISARQCVMFGSVLVCLVYIVSAFAPTIEVLVFSFGLFLGNYILAITSQSIKQVPT